MVSDVSQKNLFISVEEAEQLLRSISPAEQKYRIILLLVAHGCRPCEAVALNITDFISQDCTRFYVSNTKVVRRGKQPRRDLKIIPAWLGLKIKEYVEEAYRLGLLRGGWLFPTDKPHKYEHMTTGGLFAWFAEHRRRAGLDRDVVAWKPHWKLGKIPQYRVGLYSLRRMFATELAFNGADQRVIAALMGHKDIKTTSQYQDMLRLLQKAPLELAKMPRLFGNGQLRLSAFH